MGYNVGSIRPKDCWWGVLDSAGILAGTTGSVAAGSDAGMGQFDYINGISIPSLQTEDLVMPNGTIKQVNPLTQLVGTLTSLARDLTWVSKYNGLSVATMGDTNAIGMSNQCPPYVDMCLIANRPAINSSGQRGYSARMGLSLQFSDPEQYESQYGTEAESFAHPFASAFVDTAFWGDATLSVEWGVSKLHFIDFEWSAYPWTAHAFVHDNSATSFTVDQTPAAASADKVLVYEAGVLQAYTTDYVVTTATKTISGITATTSGTKMVVLYQYVPSC